MTTIKINSTDTAGSALVYSPPDDFGNGAVGSIEVSAQICQVTSFIHTK